MKKPLILFTLTLLSSAALNAQVTDSAGNPIKTQEAVPTPQTTTTTTTVTTPAPAATPVPPPPLPPPATTVTTTTTASAVPVDQPSKTVSRLRFGAFVAPNISWMKPVASTDDAGNYKVESKGGKVGFTYGLMVDYNFAPNYGLVSGLSINSTGGKILSTAVNSAPIPGQGKVVSADFDYKLQYLDIPIALKLRTDDIKKFRFFGQLGLTLGINIAKKADYTVKYYDAAGALKEASGSNIKLNGSSTNIAPAMFQMNIGAGGEFPLNNKLAAYFGVFFNNGFTPDATNPSEFDAGKLGYQGSFADGKIRLNNLALRLGLFF